MTNTRRNTIVLSSLLCMISLFTLIQLNSLKRKKDDAEQKNSLLIGQISVLENQISNIDSLKRAFLLQQEMVAQQSKLLISDDNPSITYQYLLKLMNWMNRDIIFDFSVSAKTSEELEFNEYIISGRTHFASLVSLVNNIEHQRTLLTIEELSIGNDNVANSDSVSFSMVFRTHYKPGGADPDKVTPKSINTIAASYMLFNTRLFENARPVSEVAGRINLDSSTLIGLSKDKIFMRDSQGIIRILSVGDRVSHGYLSAINVSEEKAVFKLDLYGITEDKSIFLKRN